jgi:AraC-like DNA-binding protein
MCRARTSEGAVGIVLIESAPPGSRWCGTDLEPGTLLLYGPGHDHTEVSYPGLAFSLVEFTVSMLETVADRRQLPMCMPESDHEIVVGSSPEANALRALLETIDLSLQGGSKLPDSEEIVSLAVEVMALESRGWTSDEIASLNSRRIVNATIDFADRVRSIPSVCELRAAPSLAQMSRAVHVSERRLRNAFYDTFGIAPMRFFRLRGLNRAHLRLLSYDMHETTVAHVAMDYGFTHLGRFSSYYQEVFDELPSATLHSTSSHLA